MLDMRHRILKIARIQSVLLCCLLAACGSSSGQDPETGDLQVMIYNVAGLPEGLSGSNPVVNIPQMSPLLNSYELILVQEDFWYHDELALQAGHPHKSEPMWPEPTFENMGDGLNRFSNYPFNGHYRQAWEVCYGITDNGSDCMTTKGFSVARHELGEGIYIDIYNLHMDASGDEEDQQARAAQTEQLLIEIAARSSGNAVIVAGDTNLKNDRPDRPLDKVSLERLLSQAELQVACRTLNCQDERIDRIMYRSSASLTLTPTDWSMPPEFVDNLGEGLSDHEPVLVPFSWTFQAE